ncbi:MAG TPA: lipoprotein-releasing ABC transporter permease subunit [Myxococcales bacterium]|nr:lipoprotein-releasing ABC transporter permease subunit [Myxococcales bacterium]
MELFPILSQGAASVGGGVALAFIVSLALGLVGLILVYGASAVVVLDGFARVSRRPVWPVLSGVAVALLAGIIGLQWNRPELALQSWEAWRVALMGVLPRSSAGVALAMGVVWGILRYADPARVGVVLQWAVALSLAVFAAARGFPELPLALSGPPGLVALGLWGRRHRQGAGTMGGMERRAWELAIALALGAVAALLPAELRAGLGAMAVGGLVLLGGGVFFGLVPFAVAGLIDMRGSAEWFIAIRYLVARRRQVFISAITAICILGIAAGVWLIVVVLSVMNGFEQTWREEILGNRAHFVVESQAGSFADYPETLERIRRVPGVVAVSPFLDADAMVRGRSGEIYSVRVRGVDPEQVSQVTRLAQDMVSGSLSNLKARGEALPRSDELQEGVAGAPAIVIGNQLASALGVDLGDALVVISPFGGPPTPMGPSPRLTRFRVEGVFRSSFYQFDEAFAYVTLEAAQAFRRSADVIDGVEALTTDHYRSQRVADAVAVDLGYPFETRDWKEFFPAFFQALKTERIMMFILLTMIMVVAAFVIVATLIMMIMEKSGDIAILKAMGAEDSLVERIFALEGTLIGLVGTLLGVVAAVAVTHRLGWIQERIENLTGVDTLPASIYQFSSLPSRLDPLQVGGVALIAMVLSLGATLLPSRQGARIDPAEGLRHD